MAWFRRKANVTEDRAQTIAQSSPNFMRVFGLEQFAVADISVTQESALGVPAVWAAVNFIAGTIAGLPLQVFRRDGDARRQVTGGIAAILHDAVNDEMSSFQWRKYSMERILTGGRSLTFIERNAAQRVTNLWPLEPSRVTIEKTADGKTYVYKGPDGRSLRYKASEIIDLPFMLQQDQLTAISPIAICRDAIAMAIAATQYGARYFRGGGVPPFVVTGNFQSPGAIQRAAEDMERAVKSAARENRPALVLPAGLDVKPLGSDPEKGQLIESKRFAVEEIARVYSIPPTFLQDLSNGTFSNTEQQDLHFVKHTIKRWVEQFEQEMNLKLFGRNSRQFVEFNVDGLLRGDFKTRMEGHARAIQTGISTPNEARRLENREPMQGGDQLYIQGATVPLGQAGEAEGETDGGA